MAKFRSDALVLIYGSGGHREQMNRIIHGLKSSGLEIELISISDIKVKQPLCEKDFKNLEIKKEIISFVKVPIAFFIGFFHLFQIFGRYRVRTVISTGPGIGIIYLLLFKLMNKRTVFLESWSRFYTKSFTGRIVYSFVDIFIIQNKENSSNYPRAIFLGSRL